MTARDPPTTPDLTAAGTAPAAQPEGDEMDELFALPEWVDYVRAVDAALSATAAREAEYAALSAAGGVALDLGPADWCDDDDFPPGVDFASESQWAAAEESARREGREARAAAAALGRLKAVAPPPASPDGYERPRHGGTWRSHLWVAYHEERAEYARRQAAARNARIDAERDARIAAGRAADRAHSLASLFAGGEFAAGDVVAGLPVRVSLGGDAVGRTTGRRRGRLVEVEWATASGRIRREYLGDGWLSPVGA